MSASLAHPEYVPSTPQEDAQAVSRQSNPSEIASAEPVNPTDLWSSISLSASPGPDDNKRDELKVDQTSVVREVSSSQTECEPVSEMQQRRGSANSGSSTSSRRSSRHTKAQDKMVMGIRAALRVGLSSSEADEHGSVHAKVKSVVYGETLKVRVKSYFVDQFTEVRALSNLPTDELVASFDTQLTRTGAGKSGSFMLWTEDHEYVAKSLASIEIEQIKKMFGEDQPYLSHLKQFPDTLLMRLVAFIRLDFVSKIKHRQPHYIIIMKNVLPYAPPLLSNENLDVSKRHFINFDLYDLKGSTVGRLTSDSPKTPLNTSVNTLSRSRSSQNIVMVETTCTSTSSSTTNVTQSTLSLDGMMFQPRKVPVWKDLNFIKSNRKVSAPLSAIQQLSADVEALAKWGVLDYSLLLAVNGDEYYMGIIDILTPFCAKKKLESVFVGAVRGKGISCVPPQKYSKRMLKFLNTIVFSSDATTVVG